MTTEPAVLRFSRSLARRAGARGTTPGRLGLVRTALVLACLLSGIAGVSDALERGDAARDIATSSGPLSANAAELYRSLAEADAVAASGFLSPVLEPPEVRADYDQDVERAATILARAGSQIPSAEPAGQAIAAITVRLPVYTRLVEAARANNRQGLPIGGTYLSNASGLMQSEILPAAETLHRIEATRLDADYRRARGLPFVPLILAVAGLIGLADVQLMERRRTNRVLNLGLVGATAALAVMCLWWGAATALARGALGDGQRHSDVATDLLDEAHIAVLQARAIESLALVTRRGGGEDEEAFSERFAALLGGEESGLLGQAKEAAPDDDGRSLAQAAIAAAREWQEAHRQVRASDDAGKYVEAVDSVIGSGPEDSGTAFAAFNQLDTALSEAVAHERAEFATAVARGGRATAGLAVGTALLALAAAACVAWGIGQRLGEYR